jgi:hypothetical protein
VPCILERVVPRTVVFEAESSVSAHRSINIPYRLLLQTLETGWSWGSLGTVLELGYVAGSRLVRLAAAAVASFADAVVHAHAAQMNSRNMDSSEVAHPQTLTGIAGAKVGGRTLVVPLVVWSPACKRMKGPDS